VEAKRPGLGVSSPPILSSKVLTGWRIYSPSAPSRHGIQRHFTVLGAFAASRSLLASPYPSTCLSECIIAARNGQIAVKFYIEQSYENPIRLTQPQMSCTLHEDRRLFHIAGSDMCSATMNFPFSMSRRSVFITLLTAKYLASCTKGRNCCVSRVNMFTRTRHSIELYERRLSCFKNMWLMPLM
jgi:hypothetical protein